MLNVFDYTDYRKFLADYYAEQKEKMPQFSYKYFANKAGFKNKGFVFNIVKGVKNLSKTSIFKISRAMNLNKSKSDYFENLVAFNQAKELDEKNHFYTRMETVKNRGNKKNDLPLIRKDQYDFYSSWYLIAIRSLIDMHEFNDDYKSLAKNVYPAITPKQAKNAVQTLVKLGLIEKKNNGSYKIKDKTITTGKEVSSLAVANFHLETMKLAADALKYISKDKRNITGLTLGISPKTYETICEEIQNFQSKILELAEKDKDADSVYQLNFHLFPLSNIKKKAGTK